MLQASVPPAPYALVRPVCCSLRRDASLAVRQAMAAEQSQAPPACSPETAATTAPRPAAAKRKACAGGGDGAPGAAAAPGQKRRRGLLREALGGQAGTSAGPEASPPGTRAGGAGDAPPAVGGEGPRRAAPAPGADEGEGGAGPRVDAAAQPAAERPEGVGGAPAAAAHAASGSAGPGDGRGAEAPPEPPAGGEAGDPDTTAAGGRPWTRCVRRLPGNQSAWRGVRACWSKGQRLSKYVAYVLPSAAERGSGAPRVTIGAGFTTPEARPGDSSRAPGRHSLLGSALRRLRRTCYASGAPLDGGGCRLRASAPWRPPFPPWTAPILPCSTSALLCSATGDMRLSLKPRSGQQF